jgi:hypothetical protein
MGFDLNAQPPDQREALPDLNEPPDKEPFQMHTLSDLNEEPMQIHEA